MSENMYAQPPGGPPAQPADAPPQDQFGAQVTSGEPQSVEQVRSTFDELNHKACARCHVGVLYVIRYDPQALHEIGQDLGADNQKQSGGAYEVECFHCDFRASYPIPSHAKEGE